MNKINIYQKIIVAYFAATCVLWMYLLLTDHKSGNLNYYYSFFFGLTPLIGGLIGMFKASIWGGLKSALGKAVFFVSFGLVLWGLGETVWSYYNFFRDVPAPYPSLADIGFAPSIFFWILGTAFLSIATGAMFALKKSHWAKVFVILAPLVLLVPSYYLQVHVARSGVLIPDGETTLKAILDIAYPFGDFLALTFAAVVYALSYRYFGGLYRKAVTFILAGLAVMYAADSIFSYSTTRGTYYNGDWGDLLLSLGLFLLTFGILGFATKPSIAASKTTQGNIQ
ncbi:MAG: domain S-box protein [Candidatus Saccharibacteria bacterium]|jgi:hypothetical protein|nr:domain S-box protein [Candidatus Saccharibacteria bacterium]